MFLYRVVTLVVRMRRTENYNQFDGSMKVCQRTLKVSLDGSRIKRDEVLHVNSFRHRSYRACKVVRTKMK